MVWGGAVRDVDTARRTPNDHSAAQRRTLPTTHAAMQHNYVCTAPKSTIMLRCSKISSRRLLAKAVCDVTRNRPVL